MIPAQNLIRTAANRSFIYYDKLLCAYETPNKAQALIVDKSGFTQGNAEELAGLLKQKLGSRYYTTINK